VDLDINWPDGLSTAVFLAEYWQKKPLLIRNAFPQFSNPLSADELAGLAMEDEITSRLVLQGSDQQWYLQPGPFSEDELTSLPRDNWSLLVSDIEKHLEGFHDYLKPFSFIPHWQIDDLMISYAPKNASVGAHIDEYDVFLLQASGHRDWSIDSSDNPDSSYIPDLELKVLANFHANESWTLAPCDMLYLPPGVPHHGIAADNDCMTWSIGFRAISYADLLSGIAQELAAEQPDTARYRDNLIQPQVHAGEIPSGTLNELHLLWQQLTQIDLPTFKKLAGNVLTARHSLFPTDDTQLEDTLDELLAHEQFQRDAASRISFVSAKDGVRLHVDGEHYRVSAALAELLSARFTFSKDDFSPFFEKADISVDLEPEHESDVHCLLALWRRSVLQSVGG